MFATKGFEERTPWKLLGLEAGLIVLSVLLALSLNSWREARGHQKLAERAVQTVVAEAEENCRTLQPLQPYHREVLAGKTEYEGLGMVMLRNDAWTSAQTAGAAMHVDYKLAAVIGAIHAIQQDHRHLVHSGLQAVYTVATGQGHALKMLRDPEHGNMLQGPHPMMLADLIRMQNDLFARYGELFALAEDHYGVASGDDCHPVEMTVD